MLGRSKGAILLTDDEDTSRAAPAKYQPKKRRNRYDYRDAREKQAKQLLRTVQAVWKPSAVGNRQCLKSTTFSFLHEL